jgi:cellobiose phosphorylase
LNQRGGVFVLRGDLLSADDRVLIETVARTVLTTRRGDLSQHMRRREGVAPLALPAPQQSVPIHNQGLPELALNPRNLYGGFDSNGEYVIDLAPGQVTPAPWSNVIANEHFGFLVTERGGGFTWANNSRENRLTPWSNDPVSDPIGEAIYLRDQDNGMLWSPTLPPADNGHIRIRHGFGYSTFSQHSAQIASELRLSVSADDPVKLYRLRLKNTSDTPRNLSITLYVEWVLGVFRADMAPYVVTSFDTQSGALLANNSYNTEFGPQLAFIASSERSVAVCGDRVAFIGRNGDLQHPAALYGTQGGEPLSGQVGAGFDPCGAIQCEIALEANQEREVVFLLGQATDLEQARDLITRYREPIDAAHAEQAAIERWHALLGQVQVHTPQPELDLLLNGWLLYQTLACRIWARSAFYQSGGAYGFRDQLQDVMALVHTAPAVARAQILRAAARQFLAGDVQHWWHPPTGRGVRTRFSDDYLWLPFVVAHYITITSDSAILDEITPFLEGRALKPEEAEYYDLPGVSSETGSCYEHCVRAIDYALGRIGTHGLPLMGAGDWNDGMNMVGHNGQGESVWVGWFLHMNLEQFAPLALARGDHQRATRYQTAAQLLQEALEQQAWDGEWYLRAFYDDGTPLGAAGNSECEIDSLPQSWAVIAGSGDPVRARRAMAAVAERLVDHEAGLIKLFTPPFDRAAHDPGYIQGYVPGVRENGGQYTHAAIWVIWAYALLGDGKQVGALLNLINPILHAQASADTYKVEPYTIAADVYAAPRHVGRGGWTWYTGSAGWFYRLGVEMVLGLRRVGSTLTIVPCIPPEWPSYSLTYRFGRSEYHIQVQNPQHVSSGVTSVCVDGQPVPDGQIALHDDGAAHTIQVTLGA